MNLQSLEHWSNTPKNYVPNKGTFHQSKNKLIISENNLNCFHTHQGIFKPKQSDLRQIVCVHLRALKQKFERNGSEYQKLR